jgi:hypothetical protein
VATRRLAKPRPVQGEQVPPVGGPPRDRVAAQRDGHQKQNPAYRPATEKALETGLFLRTRFAGDSSGSPRGGLTAVSVGPLGAVARRGLAACAGYEPPRDKDAITITFGDAIPSRSRFAPKLLRRRAAGRPLRGPRVKRRPSTPLGVSRAAGSSAGSGSARPSCRGRRPACRRCGSGCRPRRGRR